MNCPEVKLTPVSGFLAPATILHSKSATGLEILYEAIFAIRASHGQLNFFNNRKHKGKEEKRRCA